MSALSIHGSFSVCFPERSNKAERIRTDRRSLQAEMKLFEVCIYINYAASTDGHTVLGYIIAVIADTAG